MNTAKPDKNRDRATGQFAHEGNWDRLCVCGHTLGDHTAAKVAGEQPCIAADFDPAAVGCKCMCFRKSRKVAK